MTGETRNRRILVGGGMRGLALAVAAAQAAMLDPSALNAPIHRRELPPPPLDASPFIELRRSPPVRDWEDRKKQRPNHKRAKQQAQKMARRRQRKSR